MWDRLVCAWRRWRRGDKTWRVRYTWRDRFGYIKRDGAVWCTDRDRALATAVRLLERGYSVAPPEQVAPGQGMGVIAPADRAAHEQAVRAGTARLAAQWWRPISSAHQRASGSPQSSSSRHSGR